MSEKPAGLTQSAGWQAGVRRTLSVRPELAWDFLFKPDVLRIWLGETPSIKFEEGAEFQLSDGTHCRLSVYQPGSQLRMQWQPAGYAQPAVLQVRLLPAGEKTTFAFHQEKLPDQAVRQERLDFFHRALDQMKRWL